ncbi:hypothetical protein SteCoe_23413 [Stentor coeruleus]|uniref:G domain-containing protein n=1 Tax=Stentor coeruleus TaxID=5963 RepID=A0A1R2BK08_9CILI|nr:hypothetical protein SteCoe_23413 [Stentor coeruleus]
MEQEEESKEDINKLTLMLDEADMKIIVTNQQTINLLGKTGAGKSTTLCLLSDLVPRVEESDYGEIIIDFDQQEEVKIEIGHSNTSCTTLPNFMNIKGELYWDCPGFCDNKSIMQEIVNLFCIKKIFDSALSYKIVLVISFDTIISSRGRELAETLRQLVEMFPEHNKLFNCLSIIVTKCTNKKYTSNLFVTNLAKMAAENNEFELARPLISKLSTSPDKVAIFRIPNTTSDINEELRNEIKSSVQVSNYEKLIMRNSLSDRAKLAIDRLIELYDLNINEKMSKFAEGLIIKFRSENDMNSLNQGKTALEKFSELFNIENPDIKMFESGMLELCSYFTGSELQAREIKNLTFRIEFYNSYRSPGSPKINLASWISHISTAKSVIEGCINFQNEAEARKQAEKFNKENKKKIDELNKQIENKNSKDNEIMEMMKFMAESNAQRDEANQRMLMEMMESNKKMVLEIANMKPQVIESGGGGCIVI